jgi:hypothetical protein
MLKEFYNYGRISRKTKKIHLIELPKEQIQLLDVLRIKLEKYRDESTNHNKPQKQIASSKTNSTSFDILKRQDWILDWNCVMFKRGVVVIYARSDAGVKFKPTTVQASGSMESFNYLKKYLNERLPPVHCTIIGMTLTVKDSINFKSAIQQFATAARQGVITTRGTGLGTKYNPLPMSFSQALSKAKQMTPEEFKKYKSKYIDHLVTLQSKNYKVIPCVERLAHSNSDTSEYAFMFSVDCRSGKILIIHENVNPDRSTLLFLVREENFNKTIREIYDFLQGAEVNKRSSLRDRSIEIKNADIEKYRSINHDDLYSWKSMITFYKNYS